MHDNPALAARRWIAERLVWERFLDELERQPEAPDTAARDAA
jgi:hypothetical protein